MRPLSAPFRLTRQGHPLHDLETGDSPWEADRLYELVDAAHDWGVRPSALGLCEPDEDAALMVAYTQARGHVAAVERKKDERRHR